jgi:hypothetical protein
MTGHEAFSIAREIHTEAVAAGLYYVYEDQSAPCAPETAAEADKLANEFFKRAS